ncbi:MAG: hypothetical protein Q8Q06_04635 [bacterium]|nr:hypothetical protein [bacterium]
MAKLTQKLSDEVFAGRVLECIKKKFKSVLDIPLDFITLSNTLVEENLDFEHTELEDALNFLASKNQNKLAVSRIRLPITDITKISFRLTVL